jgi:hypothetical protein
MKKLLIILFVIAGLIMVALIIKYNSKVIKEPKKVQFLDEIDNFK